LTHDHKKKKAQATVPHFGRDLDVNESLESLAFAEQNIGADMSTPKWNGGTVDFV